MQIIFSSSAVQIQNKDHFLTNQSLRPQKAAVEELIILLEGLQNINDVQNLY